MILRRAILVAVLICMVSTAGYAADCLMGRYSPDQRSYTAEHLQLPVALNWEFTATKFDNNAASPVVSEGKCYFACGDRVYAVELETGKMLWKYPSDQPLSSTVKCTPVLHNGMLYFGAGDGNMYCIDCETGAFQWAYQTRGAIRCPPVVYDGIIYFGADDNSVYAVDAESGDAVWPKPFTAKDDMAYGVAVSLGIVVVSCMDGNLYGINASSGKPKWQCRLPNAPVRTSPIISESIAIMTLGDVIYGYTARSGQLRWVINLPSEAAANPASDGATLYVACRDKKIYAYTLNTRQPAMKWTASADFGTLPMSSPVIADDTLYITGSKGVIGAFSTEDGTVRWRYMIAPAANSGSYTDAASSPTIANGTLTVLTDDGVLHCFAGNAPDAETPVVYDRKPANASSIPAVPPFKISAIVYDIGSGVDFSTVSVTLDNRESVDYTVDNSTSTVTAIYGASVDGKPVRRLSDGVHKITLAGKDYAGNPLKAEWVVFADSRLTPPKQPVSDTGKRTKDPVTGQPGRPGGWSGGSRGSSGGYDRSRGSRGNRGEFSPPGDDSDRFSAPPPPPPPMPTPGGGSAPGAPTVVVD